MTIDQFNGTPWKSGMTARYHADGQTYPIASCDFGECLIGLKCVVQNEPDEISWVRCENITLNAPNMEVSQDAGRKDNDAK